MRKILVLIAISLTSVGGCAQQAWLRGAMNLSSQTVAEDPEVFVKADPGRYEGARLAILPFSAPAHLKGVTETVTTSYARELLQVPIFSTILVLTEDQGDSKRSLLKAQSEGCNAVLLGRVSDLLDAGGAQSTRLALSVQLLDAETGETLWYVQQRALSSPGADLDLFWRTLPGENASGYKRLAHCLARQFGDLLAQRDQKRR